MEKKNQLDTLDKKILNIITKDARTPFLEVARECGVSGAAIHQRVQKLIKSGIISGSEYVIDPNKVGFHTCAYMGIHLESASMYKSAVQMIKKIPEVTESYYTTGNYSIFTKIYAMNNDHLRSIMVDKLQTIPGVVRTETVIVLEENFKRQLPIL